MTDDRKCYRLIGGVLVERTKKEVLPAVQTNLEQITQLIERLQQQLIELEQAALDFRKKHDLQTAGPRQPEDDADDEDKKDKKPTGLLA
jgi:prefoldin subunit 2